MAFNIDKICSTINQIIEKLTIPFAYIQPEILVCSAIRRPGLSAIAIVSNIISRKSEAGAPVGLSADGTPNVEEAVERIRIEEIVKGIKKRSRVQIGIPIGGIKIKATGGNAGGPIEVFGFNITAAHGDGILS